MIYTKTFLRTSDNNKICVSIYKRQENIKTKRIPVILVHGILNSSDLFDVPGLENLSLVKTFLDRGFDVYTYDQRGSGESRCENWDFGLAENAFIDLPSILNFVLDDSRSRKVILGGYSLGGLIIYCLVTYLLKNPQGIQGVTSDHIENIFTIASPGTFHKRTGKWKNMFTRS
jgi:pimeloyl-ACP methyl ester carboxylesterase